MEHSWVRAEQAGLRLAIVCRTIALAVLGAFFVASRSDAPERALQYAVAMGIFAALGLAHYFLIGTRFDRRWLKYAFVTIDVAIVSVLIAVRPLYETAELSRLMVFRTPVFPLYFIVLGIAAFSFSPGLVLWTGIAGALGWLAAYKHASSGLERVLNWSDIPPSPDAAQVMAVILDPDFGGSGSRIQEAIALAVVALLIAAVMWRARTTLRRQLAAEREHAAVVGMFGRFVPQAVVDSMIAGQGALAPVEREATILFADIAGFTQLTERAGPARTVEILNEYFDEATSIVGARGGVVTQFQGDAILATFNVPVEDKAHAAHAFEAAQALLLRVGERSFGGERLRVRIGINTGVLVAGNVGGGGRQTYTVHGDTVNLAARLEALNKEHGTSLLVSERTAAALPHAGLVEIGSVPVRGLSAPVRIYTVR